MNIVKGLKLDFENRSNTEVPDVEVPDAEVPDTEVPDAEVPSVPVMFFKI